MKLSTFLVHTRQFEFYFRLDEYCRSHPYELVHDYPTWKSKISSEHMLHVSTYALVNLKDYEGCVFVLEQELKRNPEEITRFFSTFQESVETQQYDIAKLLAPHIAKYHSVNFDDNWSGGCPEVENMCGWTTALSVVDESKFSEDEKQKLYKILRDKGAREYTMEEGYEAAKEMFHYHEDYVPFSEPPWNGECEEDCKD